MVAVPASHSLLTLSGAVRARETARAGQVETAPADWRRMWRRAFVSCALPLMRPGLHVLRRGDQF